MIQKIRSLISFESLPDFLEKFLHYALEEVSAERGVLVLLQDLLLAEKRLTYISLSEKGEEEKGGYIYDSIIPDEINSYHRSPRPQMMRGIMREVLRLGRSIVTKDSMEEPVIRAATLRSEVDFGSAICVPVNTNSLFGLLYLDHTEANHFSDKDCQRLELLTNIASLRILNLLNLRFQFILSAAITQFNSTLEREKLVEMVLNEFKLRLGFGRVLFFRVKEDQDLVELEKTLPEEIKDTLALADPGFHLDRCDGLLKALVEERQLVTVERMRKGEDGTIIAYVNGQRTTISNLGVVKCILNLGLRPFLAIPLSAPDQSIGFWVCDKFGLPIILGEEGKNFIRSLSDALALAMDKADRYQDMKERLGRSYEERLRREALASLASLVKDLSHVISSPVRRIINTSSIITREIDELVQRGGGMHSMASGLKDKMENILSASLVIRKYVTYLRELAQLEQLEPDLRESNLDECIASAWYERVARFFPSVQMKIGERDHRIESFLCDSLQITSVLANLFMNAARAMKYGGGTILVTTRLNGDFVRISIEDEGPGIPEDILREIFSLEMRMRADWPGEGAGTGLLICKEIIFRHRGNIEIRSTGGTHMRRYGVPVEFMKQRRNKGTEVHIELPYRREALNSSAKGMFCVDRL